MALAPAALAELVDAAALLFVLLGWAVALGLLWTWRNTIGLALQNIADEVDSLLPHSILGVGLPRLGGPFRSADVAVQNLLSAWARGADIATGRLFAGLTWIFQEMAAASEWAARELYHSMTWAVEVWAPAYLRAHFGFAFALADVVRWAVHHFGAAEAFLRGKFDAVLHGIEGALHWTRAEVERLERWSLGIDRLIKQDIRHHTHDVVGAAVIPAVGEIPVPIGRTIADLKRLARRHEGLFAAGIMAAVMANVLGLASPRCLTKGPIGRVSRALCGLGSNALSDLLGLIVDAVAIGDPCDTMTVITKAADLAQPTLSGLASGAADAIGRCGYNLQTPLEVAPLTTPAVAALALTEL